MDHFQSLWRFRINTAPLIQIPYLCFNHESYPLCSFQEYPNLRRWTSAQIATLKAAPTLESYSKEVLSMLQGWLFIGSLEDIVQRRIPVKEFLVETKKRPLISTSLLVPLLEEWTATFGDISTEEKQKR